MAAAPHPEPRALRLTFAYEGCEVRHQRTDRVAMMALPGSDAPLSEGAAGAWVEVADAAGAVLYRRPLHAPVRLEAEVYPEDSGAPIRREPLPRAEGLFEVIVPDLPEAAHVAVWGDPPGGPERRAGAAWELVRVPIGPGAEHTAGEA